MNLSHFERGPDYTAPPREYLGHPRNIYTTETPARTTLTSQSPDGPGAFRIGASEQSNHPTRKAKRNGDDVPGRASRHARRARE